MFLPYSFSGALIRGDFLLLIIRKKTLVIAGIIFVCLTVAVSIFALIFKDTSSLYTINLDEEKSLLNGWILTCPIQFWKNSGS